MARKLVLTVEVKCPPGFSAGEMKDWIVDNILAGRGSLPTEDPRFHLEDDDFTFTWHGKRGQ